jgi:hypothetical protein
MDKSFLSVLNLSLGVSWYLVAASGKSEVSNGGPHCVTVEVGAESLHRLHYIQSNVIIVLK